MKCFWCGETLGRKFGELRVGGVPKQFHVEMFKDCKNEYQKFLNSKDNYGFKPVVKKWWS